MQFLAYLFIYPLIWLISILPFPLFYALSDFVFFMMYRVFKYRKQTVRSNLRLALPHLTDAKRSDVEKKFFRHVCDMFLETAKTMSISRQEIEKRFVFKNLEIFKDLETKNKSIVLVCGHYASYEWVVSINHHLSHKGFAIYKKMNNPYFDKLVKKIRNKWRATLITTSETVPTIESNSYNGVLSVYGFASDQSPRLFQNNYWADFMGINVPVYNGMEVLARKYDMNIIFLRVKKVKRGFYEATFELMTDNIASEPENSITEAFLDKVESQIYEQPEYYFWTHKRWKHAGKNPNLQTTN
ncbi:MAG: Lipid biosynthesis lauroyltransferase [Bacteroidota bacterium]